MSQLKSGIEFHWLQYDQLPDFGIYLDQMLSVVNDALAGILNEPITSPMINNYIKNKALPSAVKKRYYRDHVCRLIIMGMLKPVFSVQQIAHLFEIIEVSCTLENAYIYFCSQFSKALAFGFQEDIINDAPLDTCPTFSLLSTMARAAAYRVNAERYLMQFTAEER